ncbi:LysR family transcriptional regulator [Donghicola tyrosinivorans]|uniref:LysR family glycine cleavage system transcriptional activator n=1 Tax=Donghicola tyrosinivorans TaxID=1652492 RepID=A0A2T0WLY0_9RHOB|nr:LysR family transcriptional regulator [Donghicola tyrosinivorans]PRY87697.1 LysR family glycine cleavage system transcriptional activator [Donghicola tyrosinivorans]
MRTPRRFLPSLSLLQAFEAAARTQSVTAAAHELSLTQSAVSRQIKALEEQLGTDLFHRERQTIRLTAGGERYARDIREALQKISAASMNLRANPTGGTLSLAILPTFGTRWLAPRLPDFLQQTPGITINLVTKIQRFDFGSEAVDAAIHFGKPDWTGCDFLYLMGETVVPACSPELLERLNIQSDEDLMAAPLLHLTSRPDAWERYFDHAGIACGAVHGMLFDQFATAAQAAMAGIGIALLPEFLIKNELDAGTLVRARPEGMRSDAAYYLCWPYARDSYPPLVAFRDWLARITAPTSGA